MRDLLQDLNLRCEFDVPLAPLTWYGVGGQAAAMAHPSSVQQLSALAQRCHDRSVSVYVLGSGANLLVADEGVQGVVVKLDDPAFRQMRIDKSIVIAGAGYDLGKLVLETAKAGLSGLECLAGIPSTVGGAVRMNAGGAFGDVGKSVRRVQVMDASGQVYYRDRDDLVFSYRKSNIAARFILEVEFELAPDDPDGLMRQVHKIFLYKKTTQPLSDSSAGCVFKNPPPPGEEDEASVGPAPGTASAFPPGGAAGITPEMVADDAPRGVPAHGSSPIPMPGMTPGMAPGTRPAGRTGRGSVHSAGKLIDMAGLKGFRIGGAEVSDVHANFIVARAGCTARDILQLMEHVQRTVYERFGVMLEREVVVWP